jgi:hypothetical protein
MFIVGGFMVLSAILMLLLAANGKKRGAVAGPSDQVFVGH